MQGAKRCPQCHHTPTVSVFSQLKGYTVTLECQKHGHMAMGDSLEQATDHWNIYIGYVETGKAA